MNQQLECSKKEHSDDMALKAKAYFVKQIKLWVLIRDAQILLLVLLCHYIVAHTIYFFMLLISNLIKTNCLICFKQFSTRVAIDGSIIECLNYPLGSSNRNLAKELII